MSPLDVLVLLVVAAGAGLAVRRPTVGLLVYLWLDFMRPHDLLPQIRPFRPMLVVGVVTLLSAVWRSRGTRPFSPGTYLPERPLVYLPLLALIVAAALSTVFSIDPWLSSESVLQATKMLLLVWLLSTLVSTRRIFEGAIWVVAASTLVLGGEAIRQGLERDLMGAFDYDLVVRISSGPLSDSNDLARVLALSLPMWWFLAVVPRAVSQRLLAAGGLAAAATAIAFTFSRSGFLALLVGMVVIASSYRPAWRSVTVSLMSALAVLLILAPAPYRAQVLSLSRPLADSSALKRIEVWKDGFGVVQEHYLVGQGPGTFRGGVARRTSHNIYLEVAAEMGLIGLAAFLSILLVTGYDLWGLMGNEEPWSRRAGFCIAASLIAYLAAGLTLSGPLRSPLFVLVGLTFALRSIVSEPSLLASGRRSGAVTSQESYR